MTRPMVTVGIPFLACALLVSFLSDGVCLGLAVALAAGLLLSVFLARGAVRLRLFSIFAAALCACAGWMGYLKYRAAATDFLPGGSFSVTGVIEDYEPADSGRGAYTVRVISHDAKGLPAEFKALLYADGDLDCTWYDRIMVKAEILPFFKTPEFDGERYYRSQGIEAVLSAKGGARIVKTGNRPPAFYARRLNQRLCERADRLFSQPAAGLVKAIFLGNGGDMDQTVKNYFVRTGITHIFVVSGLHVSLLAGIFLLLLKRFGISPRVRALLAGVALWGFVALTGFGLPAVRAGIMFSVVLLATLFRRPADTLNSLFLAGGADCPVPTGGGNERQLPAYIYSHAWRGRAGRTGIRLDWPQAAFGISRWQNCRFCFRNDNWMQPGDASGNPFNLWRHKPCFSNHKSACRSSFARYFNLGFLLACLGAGARGVCSLCKGTGIAAWNYHNVGKMAVRASGCLSGAQLSVYPVLARGGFDFVFDVAAAEEETAGGTGGLHYAGRPGRTDCPSKIYPAGYARNCTAANL